LEEGSSGAVGSGVGVDVVRELLAKVLQSVSGLGCEL
jgi:hypothetical protein